MTKKKISTLYGVCYNKTTNARLIEMHLYEMLQETGQFGAVRWDSVMGFCIGYYNEITLDHIVALRELERTGAILK